jgi:CheY-like chemotaxis protein
MTVDDDPATQQVLSVLIDVEPELSPADQAYSGTEALAHVATLSPDIIICDVNMPGMSGLQALPLLRQACPDAVIALYSSHPMARTGLQRGADAVFDKSSTDPSMMLGELLRLCQAARCADAH